MLFVFSLTASAQDWELFPLGALTYYADSLQDTVAVESFFMDSIRPVGSMDVLYFNKRARVQMLGPCASSIQDPFSFLGPDALRQDSLIQRNDTVFYRASCGTLPFFFLPHASVGQSWNVTTNCAGNPYNTITIQCTSMEQRTFLGITDSVKIFSMVPNGASPGQTPVSDFQFVLSKAHGLVEFVPFDLFLSHPSYLDFRGLKMVGYHNGVEDAGFSRPGFTDYFHLHASDVLYWEVHERPASIQDPETYEYYKDSITSTINTADSVIYYADRTYQHWDGSITYWSGLVGRYYRDSYDVLFQAGTKDLVFMHYTVGQEQLPIGSFSHDVLYAQPYATYTNNGGADTITQCSFTWGGHYWDSTSCEVFQQTDTDYGYKMNTRAGYSWMSFGFLQPFQVHTNTLISSVINGVQDGDFTLGIHSPRIIERYALIIQPNPARESITFQGIAPDIKGEFTVFDGLGREVLNGSLPSASIQVQGLLPGLYVVQVRLAERTTTARFAKE